MKQCRACSMLFRAKVRKCPSCGSYDIAHEAGGKSDSTPPQPPANLPSQPSTRTQTKARRRGYTIPQTPTPLQGESTITPELLRKSRGIDSAEHDAVEIEETPTADRRIEQHRRVAQEFEKMLGDIATDATVEIPNPLNAGLDFSSDVFLDDRLDPSVERPMPELRQDPSVEKDRPILPLPDDLGLDVEEFGRAPTKPKTRQLPPKPNRRPSLTPAGSKPFDTPRSRIGLDDSVIDDALSGLDFSLRDPQAGLADPSLVLDLNDPMTEEEIELARSIVTGERAVTSRARRRTNVGSEPKIQVSPDMVVAQQEERAASPPPAPLRPTPAAPLQSAPPALPVQQVETAPPVQDAATHPAPPRIGSRLSAMAALFAFGGAAALALTTSVVSVGGWACVLAAAIVGAGTVMPRLGTKMELVHVIAAGTAVASTQPWALDLAQFGHVSFWRAPAAMACVGALIVACTLAIAAAESRTVAKG